MLRQENCTFNACLGKFKSEYLTGFHKRKVERKKAAIEELKQRLKQEQKKLRE
uniref:Nucleolar protein 12 n=1 Tax=Jaculus jaculus TaxID=51337 RepID=A0A8C5KAX2_JACJA